MQGAFVKRVELLHFHTGNTYTIPCGERDRDVDESSMEREREREREMG
jgi:hypothetical protein